MVDFPESFARLAAYSQGGRIRRDQFRMFALNRLQLPNQCVVFGIADLRLVENVVEMLVMPDGVAKLFGSLLSGHIAIIALIAKIDWS